MKSLERIDQSGRHAGSDEQAPVSPGTFDMPRLLPSATRRRRAMQIAAALGLVVVCLASASITWWIQDWWSQAGTLQAISPLLRRQEWNAAERKLQNFLAKNPTSTPALMMLGRTMAGQRRFTECAQMLETMPVDAPEYGEALFRAGQAWRHAQKRREAERVWRQCAEWLPVGTDRNPPLRSFQQECRRQLAGMYALERRRSELWRITADMYDEAEPLFRVEPLEMRLRYEFEMVDPTVALAELSLGKESDPNDVLTRVAIGLYQLEAGEVERARAELFPCVQSHRNDPHVCLAWIECLYKSGNYSELQQAVEQLPEHADSFASAWKYRSIVAEQAGELDRAIELARRAVELNRTDPELWYRLSQLAIRAGDVDGSRAHQATSQQLKSQLDRLSAAHKAYVEKWPTHVGERPDLAFDLGQSFEAIGRREDAEGWYRVALAENPTHSPSANAYRSLKAGTESGP